MDHYGITVRNTLRFLVPISLFSLLISICYFITDSYMFDLQVSTALIFTQALDRKYVFLIFNGILAFVAKSLKLNFTSSYHNDELYDFVENSNVSADEDYVKRIPELITLHENEEAARDCDDLDAPPNVVAAHEEEEEEEDEHTVMSEPNQAFETCPIVEGCEQQREDNDDDYDDDDDDYNDDEESVLVKEEVVSDVRVSTEDLNQKFEEFIRKMKEEIRIEARQQLIAV